jgi:hypothetical protein
MQRVDPSEPSWHGIDLRLRNPLSTASNQAEWVPVLRARGHTGAMILIVRGHINREAER